MIDVLGVTKSYGDKKAVDDLSFSVRPGRVTGFLGPNGAGKSTTMRMVVGLDRPASGQLLVHGRPYEQLEAPLRQVGALLDAGAVHPGRSARHHLLALAASNGIGARRVQEVLDLVGLADVAGKRAGTFSLGMKQRLGIAAALLGDPEVLLLDEPVNGLDPDGIRWIRDLLRALAQEGRTVFLSSHLMSEMALTADHLVILGRGRLLADISMEEMTASVTPVVRVRTPEAPALRSLLLAPDVGVDQDGDVMTVTGLSSEEIGRAAVDHHVLLHELTPEHRSLENAYLSLTRDDVEYPASHSPVDRSPRRAAA
jgi:ABC-2 type transport system ATP-binding protein